MNILKLKMDKLEKILELAQEAHDTGNELYSKGIKKRATQSRKLLMEIYKLCPEARKQLLEDQKNTGSKKTKKEEKNKDEDEDEEEVGDSEEISIGVEVEVEEESSVETKPKKKTNAVSKGVKKGKK